MPTYDLRLAVLALALAVCAPLAAHAAPRLAGNVWVIDEDDRVVTIIDAGKRHTFTYGGETIIRRGSTDRSIQDLRRGDRIVVTLEEPTLAGGIARARLIAIAGPPSFGRGLDVFR
ncbi:MAG: hypothetical protein AB1689_25180 [Thermodesulfobacteriota bacterium]